MSKPRSHGQSHVITPPSTTYDLTHLGFPKWTYYEPLSQSTVNVKITKMTQIKPGLFLTYAIFLTLAAEPWVWSHSITCITHSRGLLLEMTLRNDPIHVKMPPFLTNPCLNTYYLPLISHKSPTHSLSIPIKLSPRSKFHINPSFKTLYFRWISINLPLTRPKEALLNLEMTLRSRELLVLFSQNSTFKLHYQPD